MEARLDRGQIDEEEALRLLEDWAKGEGLK
jgi:hypothetical protein